MRDSGERRTEAPPPRPPGRSAVFAHVPAVSVRAIPDGSLLLDVREPDEWRAGHAPQAVHAPVSAFFSHLDDLPTDRVVAVVCAVGTRSTQVAAWLNANGWDAVNVDGGMVAWVAAGLPMESESGLPPSVL